MDRGDCHHPASPALSAQPAGRQDGAGAGTGSRRLGTNPALNNYRDSSDGHVAEDAALAARWADAHGIPRHRLLMGEFGAIPDPAVCRALGLPCN